MEQLRTQAAEKKTVIERLGQTDIAKLRQKLELSNKYFDLEKQIEKKTNEEMKGMSTNIKEMRDAGNTKLQEGQVQVNELNDNMIAMEDI